MTSKYDCIWYWTGGREVGHWTAADLSRQIHWDLQRQEIREMGYVAHMGTRSIGAPEGPPSDAEFKALGL